MEIDIPYETFWNLTPYEFGIMVDAYKKKLTQKSYLMWINGIYTLSALDSSVIGNSSLFRGKNSNPGKYINEPINLFDEEKVLTEEEKLTEEQKLLLTLESMQRSFESNKK